MIIILILILMRKEKCYKLVDSFLNSEKAWVKGAVVKNGLEMLLLQAFASWDIWNE